MLVIVSDLHFTDGSTSNKKNGRDLFNVHPDAFRLLFQTVSGIIKRRQEKGCQAISEVVFVYNGDIFDPLRTYDWFQGAEGIRPWDVPFQEDACLRKSHSILEKIVKLEGNEEALEWLRGG